MDAPGNDKSVK